MGLFRKDDSSRPTPADVAEWNDRMRRAKADMDRMTRASRAAASATHTWTKIASGSSTSGGYVPTWTSTRSAPPTATVDVTAGIVAVIAAPGDRELAERFAVALEQRGGTALVASAWPADRAAAALERFVASGKRRIMVSELVVCVSPEGTRSVVLNELLTFARSQGKEVTQA